MEKVLAGNKCWLDLPSPRFPPGSEGPEEGLASWELDQGSPKLFGQGFFF